MKLALSTTSVLSNRLRKEMDKTVRVASRTGPPYSVNTINNSDHALMLVRHECCPVQYDLVLVSSQALVRVGKRKVAVAYILRARNNCDCAYDQRAAQFIKFGLRSNAPLPNLVLHPSPTIHAGNTMATSPMPSSPSSAPQPPSPTMTTYPSLTYHTSLLPRSIPTPGLLDSAVSGAHYSGVDSVNERRRLSIRRSQSLNCGGANYGATRRQSALPAIPNPYHLAIVDDIKDVRACIIFFFLNARRCLSPLFPSLVFWV